MSDLISNTQLMNQLARLKKRDLKKFNALLHKLNCEKWQDLKESQFPDATAICQAALSGDDDELDTSEVIEELADDPPLGTRAQMNAMGAAFNDKRKTGDEIDGDLVQVINGAPDLATGFERASRALFARDANRAASAK